MDVYNKFAFDESRLIHDDENGKYQNNFILQPTLKLRFRPNRNIHHFLSYKIDPSIEPNLVKMTELRFFVATKMLILSPEYSLRCDIGPETIVRAAT